MNPLSALRAMPTAELQADLLAKASPAGGAIPAIELDKLSSQSNAGAAAQTGESSHSFSNFLGQMVNEVSAQQGAANQAVSGLMTGQNASLHQTMIAMEEASVSFQLMVEVRNRLLDSYQELMRMQV